MKRSYHPLLLVMFLLTVTPSFAQRDVDDYIVKDSTTFKGNVVKWRRSKIKYRNYPKDPPTIYTSSDISEFGDNGRIYIAVNINGQYYFAKKISSGRLSLLQANKQFAIQTDTSLIWFNKNNFRKIVGGYLSCDGTDQGFTKLTYTRKSLSAIAKDYHLGKCNMDNFPFRKWGGHIGLTYLHFNSELNFLKLSDNVLTPTIGIFSDLPLYNPRNMFLSAEVNWFSAKPNFFNEDGNNTHYYGINVNALTFLIGTKWVYEKKKVKTSLKTGVLLASTSITSSTDLISTQSQGTTIDIFREEISNSSTWLFGVNAGYGLVIPYKESKMIHLELRYIKTFGGDLDKLKLNFSGLSITGGINL